MMEYDEKVPEVYVSVNMDPSAGVTEVAVVGLDNRVIQHNESLLHEALRKEILAAYVGSSMSNSWIISHRSMGFPEALPSAAVGSLSIINDNPEDVVAPDGYGWMGFSIEWHEQNETLEKSIHILINRKASELGMEVVQGIREWPAPSARKSEGK